MEALRDQLNELILRFGRKGQMSLSKLAELYDQQSGGQRFNRQGFGKLKDFVSKHFTFDETRDMITARRISKKKRKGKGTVETPVTPPLRSLPRDETPVASPPSHPHASQQRSTDAVEDMTGRLCKGTVETETPIAPPLSLPHDTLPHANHPGRARYNIYGIEISN